ncbi:MAG: hypothetical protein ACM3Q1_00230 [Bacteroidales bacterium]
MIDALNATAISAPVGAIGATDDKDKDKTGAFDAALLAAQRVQERQQQHASEIDSIKSKGFTAWARDTQIEALKEKLRKMVMAEMGLDEDQLSHMSSAMRQILEAKIQEEIQRRMEEELAKSQSGDQNANGQNTQNGQSNQNGPNTQSTQATQTAAVTAPTSQQDGKKDQDGKTCPVIPALCWPGAASLF